MFFIVFVLCLYDWFFMFLGDALHASHEVQVVYGLCLITKVLRYVSLHRYTCWFFQSAWAEIGQLELIRSKHASYLLVWLIGYEY